MTKKLSIGGLNLIFVFRYKWDGKARFKFYDRDFKAYEIGLWLKVNKIVGKKDFNNPNKWKDNFVNNYIFGIKLFFIKAWISIDLNGKHINIS